MRLGIWTLCLLWMTMPAFAKPALVLLKSSDSERVPTTVLREMREQVIVAVEVEALANAKVAYTLLDEVYQPGYYLFSRPGRELPAGSKILWEDKGSQLLKLASPPREKSGGQSILEKPVLPRRESRPPSHLDDPELDAWLLELADRTHVDSVFSYVETLATYNRYSRWASNDSAAAWIRAKFESYGYDSVYYHPFTARGSSWNRVANNVIAVLAGTEVPDSIVIIGGHLDATSQSPSTAAPGADDNASGTAGVIEAARLLAGQTFRYTIMFVAFNGEEQGLQGSAALAELMNQQNRNVVGLLNMDMIGYYQEGGDDLWLEGFYSGARSIWLCDVLWDNCEQFTTLEPYLYPQNGYGSDHESFHDEGFVAVLSIEYEYEDYPCYHRTCDLPSQLTPDFLRQMAVVNIVTAAELAGPILAPESVSDLTIHADETGLVLRWSASAGAASYRIYRGTVAGQSVDQMELLTTQTGTQFTDGYPAGTLAAFYVVIAEN